MRIASFWAKGFRSLRDVRLDDLGAFNVFYGPNGSGKSNILAAIGVLLQIARREKHLHKPGEVCSELTDIVLKDAVIRERDLCARDDSRTIVLGAHFTSVEGDSPMLGSGPLRLTDLTLECTIEWIVQSEPRVRLTRMESNGEELLDSAVTSGRVQHLRALLRETLPMRAYTLIGAERFLPEGSARDAPYTGVEEFGNSRGTGDQDLVAWCVRHRQLARALFIAANSPSSATHQRLEALHTLLEGSPLKREKFRPVQDPQTGVVELRERLPEPNPDGLEVPLNLAGLGIAQVYAILAQAMLSGARAIGIEEPEAHLHAPTTGRHLRELLLRLVNEKHIDQLFIATHSNLFDLDPQRYFDVSLKNGETVVEPADLTHIDHDHLYEPGPAKHALRRMLDYMPPDEIMFRRGDGSPVSAAEMLKLLQNDDPLAVDFLKDVHGAAITMVKVAKKKGK